MMNAPTTTPMAANPSSASVKNPRNCRTGLPTLRRRLRRCSAPRSPDRAAARCAGAATRGAARPGRAARRRVDRVLGVELALRGREVERREGHRAEVVACHRSRTARRSRNSLGRSAEQHPHPVADLEPVLRGGAGVHRHLDADRSGGAPGREAERAVVDPRDPEGGRPAPADVVRRRRRRTARARSGRSPRPGATPGTARPPGRSTASGIRPASDTSPSADAPCTRRSTPEQRLGEHRVERLLDRCRSARRWR